MRTLLLSALALTFSTSSALAQALALVPDSLAYFPYDANVGDYAWELRTLGGDFVRAEWNGLADPSTPFVPSSRSRRITADNASSFGVDWTVWSAAAIDPSYTIMRQARNGVIIDIPFPSVETAPNRVGFVLEDIILSLGFPRLPARPDDTIVMGVGLRDYFSVPEPASLVLLCFGLMHLVIGCRSTVRRR